MAFKKPAYFLGSVLLAGGSVGIISIGSFWVMPLLALAGLLWFNIPANL